VRNLHNHARFKTSERFDMYRSLHLGGRGYAGSEYYLVDKARDKATGFDTQRDVNAYLEQAGFEVQWQSASDYKEIVG
jgi:hypothetical protein